MASFERFEDIEAWKRARHLSKAVYDVSNSNAFARDYGLRDQIRRAVVSIMSNIAEGFERGGNREFIQYLFIARGSAAEVQAQLYIALDAEYITQEQFTQLYDMGSDITRIITGLIRYLKTC
ncbi:four helix bundle protein [Dehalogenimonas sp. THU2]|uniref:four helix bundle protein n=1 Tax=Dehalogenimonas sp. THU2 TaxID=3151121 RepID=UPI003218137F